MSDEVIVAAMDPPSDSELKSVSELAERQRRQIQEVGKATTTLQEAIRKLRQTSEFDLPNAMRNAGVSDYRLLDGTRVRLTSRYIGNQLEDTEGLEWVEAHNGSSLVKTVITISMDRGDLEKARELLQDIRLHRHANSFKELDLKESIHAMTIGAFVRELIEGGVDVPLEKLGVRHEVSTVVGERRPKTVDLKGIVLKTEEEDE